MDLGVATTRASVLRFQISDSIVGNMGEELEHSFGRREDSRRSCSQAQVDEDPVDDVADRDHRDGESLEAGAVMVEVGFHTMAVDSPIIRATEEA